MLSRYVFGMFVINSSPSSGTGKETTAHLVYPSTGLEKEMGGTREEKTSESPRQTAGEREEATRETERDGSAVRVEVSDVIEPALRSWIFGSTVSEA